MGPGEGPAPNYRVAITPDCALTTVRSRRRRFGTPTYSGGASFRAGRRARHVRDTRRVWARLSRLGGFCNAIAQHRLQRFRPSPRLRRVLSEPDMPENVDVETVGPGYSPLLLREHRHGRARPPLRTIGGALGHPLSLAAAWVDLLQSRSSRLLPESRVAADLLNTMARSACSGDIPEHWPMRARSRSPPSGSREISAARPSRPRSVRRS
jgi:hypothetical protein